MFSLGDDGIWSFQQELHPTNFESQADRFGHSVATSGDRIVVGADLDDMQGEDSGAAYVYHLSDGVWRLESKLIATVDPGMVDNRGFKCGHSVGISDEGTLIVVGCPNAPAEGAAYVYQLKDNGTWVQKMKLSVPEDRYLDIVVLVGGETLLPVSMRVGSSVALSGDMALIGHGEMGEIFSYVKDC